MEKQDLTRGISATSITGLPVYSLDRGSKLGYVKDVIYDTKQNKLLAFTLETRGIFSPDRFILPFDKVKSVGDDAVMVETGRVFKRENEFPEAKRAIHNKGDITHRVVMTLSGEKLGAVSDILIDEETGNAISYEVTGGLAQDIGSGRDYVDATHTINVGYDAIIVPDSVATFLQEQEPGGIAGAYRGAKRKTTAYTEEQLANMVRGKTAGNDVYDDLGNVIVARGQIITDSVIEEAKAKGKLNQLAYAAGAGGVTGGYEQVAERAAGAAGEKLKGKAVPYDIMDDQGNVVVPKGAVVTDTTIRQAKEQGVFGKLAAAVLGESTRAGTESVWTQIRDWFANAWNELVDLFEESSDKAARNRALSAEKKFLTGKVSANDVRDKTGSVILQKGEIITPLIMDNLERQGMLEAIRVKPEDQPVGVYPTTKEQTPSVHVVLESAEEHGHHRAHI